MSTVGGCGVRLTRTRLRPQRGPRRCPRGAAVGPALPPPLPLPPPRGCPPPGAHAAPPRCCPHPQRGHQAQCALRRRRRCGGSLLQRGGHLCGWNGLAGGGGGWWRRRLLLLPWPRSPAASWFQPAAASSCQQLTLVGRRAWRHVGGPRRRLFSCVREVSLGQLLCLAHVHGAVSEER